MKQAICFYFLLISSIIFAQDFSDSWKGHFSFLDIKDVSQSATKIYAASDNAIFSYDILTNELTELTTINGLSGEIISTIHYSEIFQLLIIGYENGLIEIAFDDNTDILSIIDILDKPTIPPNQKQINHFNEHNGLVYISTDFGISIYDLDRLEFGDTYFIGNLGSQLQITQTTIFGDYIYASTHDGIKKALVANDNLIDYLQWQTFSSGIWLGIETVDQTLYAIRNNRRLYDFSLDTLNQLFVYTNRPLDIRSFNNSLIVTTKNDAYVYDSNFVELAHAFTGGDYVTEFTSATISENNEFFIGTKEIVNLGKEGFGILKTAFSDTSVFEEIHPQGPLKNKVFSLETVSNEIWAVHGGYSVTYNFSGGIARTGISHFQNEEWNNIPYNSIAETITRPWFLSKIAINPLNSNEVYISSYYSGVIEIINNEIITIYNQDNSTIVPFAVNFKLTAASHFKEDGTFFVTNARYSSPLNRFSNGQWQSYDFSSLTPEPRTNLGFSEIVTDAEGNIYIGSYGTGIVGFNDTIGEPSLNSISSLEQNMPSRNVLSLAIDNRGQLWVGTFRGLRVFNNPARIFENEFLELSSIIIVENGIPAELLEQQAIPAIEVDGANNKWVGTVGSGVFYFSPDGQETIYHFTTDNSPLPSNSITDIAIDNSNGIVYIATTQGLVSFQTGGSVPVDDLNEAYAYPNPVRPNFNINEEKIKIKGIAENVNIKITDIEGNLVAEAQSNTNIRFKGYNLEIDGGTAFWNGKNLVNNTVTSGVYLVMLSDLDTLETNVVKIMVIR